MKHVAYNRSENITPLVTDYVPIDASYPTRFEVSILDEGDDVMVCLYFENIANLTIPVTIMEQVRNMGLPIQIELVYVHIDEFPLSLFDIEIDRLTIMHSTVHRRDDLNKLKVKNMNMLHCDTEPLVISS